MSETEEKKEPRVFGAGGEVMVHHGELTIFRVEEIPEEAKKRKDKIIGHSETGHHHAFDANAPVWVYSSADELVQYMEVKASSKKGPAVLRHLREWDQHAEISFPPGRYQINHAREARPDGWAKVVD